MSLLTLRLLVYVAALVTTSRGTSAEGVLFEELMDIPLHKCQIVLLSHEIEKENVPTADVALVDHTRAKLYELQIPLQYWVKRQGDRVGSDLILAGLNRNEKLGCTTFILLLECTKGGGNNGFSSLQPLPWVNYAVRPRQAEHDYTILGFRDVPQDVRIEWTWTPSMREQLPIMFPENLFVVRLSTPVKKCGTVHQPENIFAVAVGAMRIFCGSGNRLCIDWYELKLGSDTWWKNPEEFYRKLARQSSYFTSHSYNFQKEKILNAATPVAFLPKRLNEVRKLGYRGGLFPPTNSVENHKLYGVGTAWSLHTTWQDLQIIEATYNGSLVFLHQEPNQKSFFSQGIIIWPGYQSLGSTSKPNGLHVRSLNNGFSHFTFHCVDSLNDPVDFFNMFNPMDKWVWASLAGVSVAMSLAFWRLIKSPVFRIVVIFFAQGDEEKEIRFSFLVVIWSLLGFLLTSGYSCKIASIFIVPPKLVYPSDVSDLYLQGYKLVIPSATYYNKDIRLSYVFSADNPIVDNKNMVNDHLKKLDEAAIVLTQPSNTLSFHDSFVNVGKACDMMRESWARIHAELYPLAYRKSTFFTCKKTIARMHISYSFRRPGIEALRGGTHLFLAAGIIHFWEMAGVRISKAQTSSTLFSAIAHRHPFFRYGYFFQILREEEPYIFSIRNAEGKMIFYFGLICVAVSLGALCIEISLAKLTKAFRTIKRWCFNVRIEIP